VARWPVILWALVNVVLRIKRPYMITPKGVTGAQPRALTLYGPGLALTLLPLGGVWADHANGGAGAMSRYYWLAIANAIIGLIVVATTLALEIRTTSMTAGVGRALRLRAGMIIALLALGAVMTVSVLAVWTSIAKVLS
jgi:cellulose synthase (UDP-forming)